MYVIVVLLINSLLVFNSVNGSPDDDKQMLVTELLANLNTPQCRKGYNAVSAEGSDTAYHCAGIKRAKKSNITFTNENVVNLKGPNSEASMFACFVKNRGLAKADGTGFDEQKLDGAMKKWFSKTGGDVSAQELKKELLECEKTHPVEFPEVFEDGTKCEPWYKCIKRVLRTCPKTPK